MKTKNLRYLPVVLLALVGCKPEKDGVFFLDPAPVFEVKVKNNPLAPDSIDAFRPILGEANVPRVFPFGIANEPAGIKLSEFIDKSNNAAIGHDDQTTYKYGASGKLIERTHLTTKGMIWDVNTYEPTTEGKIEIATKVNSGINYFRGELNELTLLGNTLYEPTNKTLSWGMKTFERYYSNNQDTPTLRTRLGFDVKGQLVWEEGIYLNAASSTTLSYKLYRRDLAGNAIFIRSIGDWHITGPTEQVLTYDNKPNPYRTTGDILHPEATNPNNILTQQTVEKGVVVSTLRYEYEYRPDGYPRLAKTYKNGELLSTREFKYNQ